MFCIFQRSYLYIKVLVKTYEKHYVDGNEIANLEELRISAFCDCKFMVCLGHYIAHRLQYKTTDPYQL